MDARDQQEPYMGNETGVGSAKGVTLSRRDALEQFREVKPFLEEKLAELEEEEGQNVIKRSRKKEEYRRLYTHPDSLRIALHAVDIALYPENPALEKIRNWVKLMNEDNTKKDEIEKAKEVSIVEVAEFFVEVRRQGSKARCLCPFHDDSSPSLVLYVDNNTFHCFACGANGDTIDLVMKLGNCSFIKALAIINGRDIKADTSNPGT